MEIVSRILSLKDQRGWTEYRLAKEAGISQSTLSNLVNRGNSPSVATLEKICDAFGISLAQFFDVDGTALGLTDDQKELMKKWSLLSPTQKEMVNIYISGMLTK